MACCPELTRLIFFKYSIKILLILIIDLDYFWYPPSLKFGTQSKCLTLLTLVKSRVHPFVLT